MEKEGIKMVQTEYSRKVDTTGRLIVPAQLRDIVDIRPGDLMTFFIHEHDGRTFLCVECERVENEIDKAKRILREAGIKVED